MGFTFCRPNDAWQHSILLLRVLRQRGNNSIEHNARKAPHVLSFDAELVLDGRSLPRSVNCGLVRIVVDPRAGHRPGIGGMKHDSEISVALAAGHPYCFVGFLPDPVPGQTIEDVCRAEAHFVEEVVRRHPNGEAQALSDRQLPGPLADHDDGRDSPETGRPVP